MALIISDETIVAVIFNLVITGLGFLLTTRVGAWSKVKSLRARAWPTVQGTVEFVRVEERRAWTLIDYIQFEYYVAQLDYSYSINNEYYSGYLEKIFLLEDSAEAFTKAVKGRRVFVRLAPARPERSALLKDDQPGWPR